VVVVVVVVDSQQPSQWEKYQLKRIPALSIVLVSFTPFLFVSATTREKSANRTRKRGWKYISSQVQWSTENHLVKRGTSAMKILGDTRN